MKLVQHGACALLSLIVCAAAPGASAQVRPAPLPAPPVTDNGVIAMPNFDLPFSSIASREARDAFVARLRAPAPGGAGGIAEVRRQSDASLAPSLAAARARYPVTSTRATIGTIPIETFEPVGGVARENRDRVLIQLHGGGFVAGGGGATGALESIPISSIARIRVVAVDYRLQPEHTLQDSVDDAVAVYRELLKTHRPENIGIYGCSAGGTLTALTTAALIRQNVPTPGVIGVFCSSLIGFAVGDSPQLWPRLGSVLRLPPAPPRDYDKTAAPDPLAVPLDLLDKFPPTLLLTGTRAPEMSGAAQSNIELLSRGVTSELVLFDGLDHGFYSNINLPESTRAYDLMTRFFMAHLGHRAARR